MKQEPECTPEDPEMFGITIMRQAVVAWQDAVVTALYDPGDPLTLGHALSLTREVKRLVRLLATWVEQHFYDEHGTHETAQHFLEAIHGDLLNEGRADFIKQTDKTGGWCNPETHALWTAGVTYIYLMTLRAIRDDDTRLRQSLEIPVNA